MLAAEHAGTAAIRAIAKAIIRSTRTPSSATIISRGSGDDDDDMHKQLRRRDTPAWIAGWCAVKYENIVANEHAIYLIVRERARRRTADVD